MDGESPQDVREKAAQDRADEVGEKEKEREKINLLKHAYPRNLL